jgi:hypothetical protein
MLPEIAWEELTVALDAVAGETLATGQVCRPPVDAVQLARVLG